MLEIDLLIHERDIGRKMHGAFTIKLLSFYMNIELLKRLKELQKTRGDVKAFAHHDEFLPWSDSVSPLLEFDEALHKKFIFWSDHVKAAYRAGREHHDALGESIGVVNQAIIKLELPASDAQKSNTKADLPYPDKVTLKWLQQHAPISLWVLLAGLMASSFLFGIAFTETPFYKSKSSDATIEKTSVKKLNKLFNKDKIQLAFAPSSLNFSQLYFAY